jgi:hypothetical protein
MIRPGFLAAAFLLFAAALCGLTGCAGYQLGPAKPSFLKDAHTLAVPAFRNNTLEPRLEALVTDTVIRQLQEDGTFQIVHESAADAVLLGIIEKVERRPARSVRGNVLLTREFTLSMRVRYQLINRATGRVLDSGTLLGDTSFFVGSDLQQNERQAIPLAAQKVAVRLTSQLTEGF